MTNIADLLHAAAAAAGDRAALVCDGERWSYAELWAAAGGAATLFRDSGAQYVALLDGNGAAGVIALFGAAIAGLPYAPLNYRRSDADLRALLARIAPAYLIVGDGHTAPPGATVIDSTTFVAAARQATPLHTHTGDGVAVQIFTSGTTGAPKAALLHHAHLLAYVAATAAPLPATAHEGSLVSVPPYHVANIVALLTAINARRRLILLPAFDTEAWLALAVAEAPTYAFLVPTMLARILDRIDDTAPLASLTAISYGAGRMPAELLDRTLTRFPLARFTNAYGLTETSATICSLSPEDHRTAHAATDPAIRARLRSAGRPLPGIDIAIRDAAGAPLPAGQRGEVYARGAQVSGLYHDRDARDADGWFATRDLGWRDGDGYLFLEGRADDVIVRGGENISPGEIEDALLAHPAIADACAVGLPSPEWGETIGVALVLHPGHAAPADDAIRAHVRTRLRSSRVPERIAVLDTLPYNDLGKLLRREVRASPLLRSHETL
ncbi:class I adenylate-forming enzyme family protein [Sphingomonas sp. BAUL-RG-20F-R05-02]|uniref:class I adenylate-forming enzyme family protein n=1 Tax=Sphingomonas sp. BAUL-RG-20F-R05-02 TaxID=2914830 RepID=UPI001F588BB6|nr:class I adenylate-forming enzyme family protein [Sphingomonas sp. BAUL-RG-20F-R05-02]